MSVVSYDHRVASSPIKRGDYSRCLNAIAGEMQQLDWVVGLVVCGSYAKGNLSIGWSDLDLVAFVDDAMISPDAIARLSVDVPALATPIVPVGIDFAAAGQFYRTRRISGRPLAMTLELARYAKPVFGKSPFKQILEEPEDRSTIVRESELLVRADANSWLRRCARGYATPLDEVFDLAKTLLRLAMFESSSHKKDAFSVEAYCAAVVRVRPETELAFQKALALRREWGAIMRSPNFLDGCDVNILRRALLDYATTWPGIE